MEVRSFALSKYEVTQEQWEAVMGENPSRFKNCPQCPVEQVSWDDIQAFLRNLNTGGGGIGYRVKRSGSMQHGAGSGVGGIGMQGVITWMRSRGTAGTKHIRWGKSRRTS